MEGMTQEPEIRTTGDVNFVPTSDWLLIEPIASNMTASGKIALPDGVDDGAPKGRVIKAGPGRANELTGDLIYMPVSVGQVVLLSFLRGAPYMDDVPLCGKKFWIARARDVVGTFDAPGLVKPIAIYGGGPN